MDHYHHHLHITNIITQVEMKHIQLVILENIEQTLFHFYKLKPAIQQQASLKMEIPHSFLMNEIKEKNELEETITLYLVSPTKYHIKYSSGYNWIIDYQLDNKMQMLLRPNPTYRALFRTTYMHQLKKYSPLVSRLDYIPTKKFNTSIQANYDLNDGEMINLNHILNTTFGSNWENRWKFNAYFTYAPKYDEDYQLQTLEIIKDLHCRQFTLIYNRLLEEIRFQFTINAFPENNIGFTSNKYESFRLEGVFDDASIQR